MKDCVWIVVVLSCFAACSDENTTDGDINPVSGTDTEISEIDDNLKGTWDLYDSTGSVMLQNALVVTDSMFGVYTGHPKTWKIVALQGQVYLEPFSSSGSTEYLYDYTLANSETTLYLLIEKTATYTQPTNSTPDVQIYRKQ